MRFKNMEEILPFVLKKSFNTASSPSVVSAITPHGIIVGFKDMFPWRGADFDIAITTDESAGVDSRQFIDPLISGKRVALFPERSRSPFIWFLL